MMFPQ